MEIDIYARWKDASAQDLWGDRRNGIGGLYWRHPKPTRFLLTEAFESEGGAPIPSAVLAKRLPHILALVEERERDQYQSNEEQIAEVESIYCDFVALCAEKERKTGEDVQVVVSV